MDTILLPESRFHPRLIKMESRKHDACYEEARVYCVNLQDTLNAKVDKRQRYKTQEHFHNKPDMNFASTHPMMSTRGIEYVETSLGRLRLALLP